MDMTASTSAGVPVKAADRRAASPQSVTRVIRILEALAASPAAVSLADLSRALDTPKSSLAALLRGLADEDFVVGVDGLWRLGGGAFGLGGALVEARRRVQSSDLVRDGMRRLAERSGETVLLAVRDRGEGREGDRGGDMLTYVDVVESRNTVRFAVAVGDRRPLYSTAAGRMLLAGAPEDEVRRYLDRVKPQRLTARTETGKRALAEAIAQARGDGVAQTVDQAADGVTGTAALLRGADGTVGGALVIAAPSLRTDARRDELAALVRAEATAISRSLGWRE